MHISNLVKHIKIARRILAPAGSPPLVKPLPFPLEGEMHNQMGMEKQCISTQAMARELEGVDWYMKMLIDLQIELQVVNGSHRLLSMYKA